MDELWKKFLTDGTVESYLKYRRAVENGLVAKREVHKDGI